MSSYGIVPFLSYSLEVAPGETVSPMEEPIGIRITHATIDPVPVDKEAIPSTLTIIRRQLNVDEDDYDDIDDDDSDDYEDDDSEMDDDDDGANLEELSEKEIRAAIKKASKNAGNDDDESSSSEDAEANGSYENNDNDLYTIKYHPLCTLEPKVAYQVPLDLYLSSGEEILFMNSGSYTIHLHGNYVAHPYDSDEEDSDSDEDDDDYDDDLLGSDSDEYDLSPDDDELIDGSDRLVEIDDEDDDEEDEEDADDEGDVVEQLKTKKEKKRAAEESAAEVKQTKKVKKEEKKVEFSKELEKGPSKSSVKKLEGGVSIEDRTVGEGAKAKSGQKIGVRYIGKLPSGKVFDSNTKGKPFYFTLGKGEVIKGWDIGVAGMAVKGERRIVIPPALAYGKTALPGIPANSELTFDVKLVSIK